MTSTGPASSTGTAELALIDAIAATLRRPAGSRVVRWLGDDCAVVRTDGAGAVVTSVDVMVDGTHFRLRDGHATPEDAGWRALAGALSDVAAMGAEPGEPTWPWSSPRAWARRWSWRCTAGPRRWPRRPA